MIGRSRRNVPVVEVEGEVVPVGKDVVAVVLADLLDDSVGVGLGNGGEHLLTKEGAEDYGMAERRRAYRGSRSCTWGS